MLEGRPIRMERPSSPVCNHWCFPGDGAQEQEIGAPDLGPEDYRNQEA